MRYNHLQQNNATMCHVNEWATVQLKPINHNTYTVTLNVRSSNLNKSYRTQIISLPKPKKSLAKSMVSDKCLSTDANRLK